MQCPPWVDPYHTQQRAALDPRQHFGAHSALAGLGYPWGGGIQMMPLGTGKPAPRPDLTQRQIDWCRKHIPAFSNRSALAEGPK